MAEAVVQMCSVKNVFLKLSRNSQENTCARVSFLIKLQATLLKKESGTGVFLLILLNFQEHFFYRTPLDTASEVTLLVLVAG